MNGTWSHEVTLFDYLFVRKFPRRPTLAQGPGPNAKSHAPIGLLDVLGAAGPEAERTYGAAVMDTPECENGHSGLGVWTRSTLASDGGEYWLGSSRSHSS